MDDMSLDPSVFEKLGAFYLGRPFDPQKKQPTDVPLLYDSRDLLTHAVCVGMTGSGKTGLCLALLEEAAIDGVPAILIDPKGDLGNLLLTFPELRGEDFRPWINEEDARRKELDPDAYAAQQAEFWRDGLAKWGEGPDRIRKLREKVDMAIYTPGSSSGIPVNVMASFDAPKSAESEVVADRVQTAVASLLGLLKIEADPVKSREFLLLSSIFTQEWTAGRNLTLSDIIGFIQNPPFSKIGVLDLEVFYPAKERFELVMALNALLAAPGFAAWQKGEALDVGNLLYTPEGKPRLAIFSIAHLDDSERMFFVSLLLNEMLAWTRTQSGTTSLRAILYMDEIFGYLPPTANPPSKLPLLTMLKQARAFGVGVVLATQNPVDLDYKALSNAGTWFIGRLQTERDKARVLDGLQGVAAGGKFDRSAMESVLAGLGNRIFLMHNVHDEGPTIFETRWTMSYLRGPLVKDQIKTLMAGRQAVRKALEPSLSGRALESSPLKVLAQRPTLSPDVPQVFFPAERGTFVYRPRLVGAGVVQFRNKRLGVDETREVFLAVPVPDGVDGADWSNAEESLVTLSALSKVPESGVEFEDLSSAAAQPKSYGEWEKTFKSSLISNQTMTIFRCPALKKTSASGETEGEFKARLALNLREKRDAEAQALREKYAAKTATLQARLVRAEASVDTQKGQATQARLQTLISIGATVFGALMGRKALSARTLGKATTAARGLGRSMKEGSDVGTAEKSADSLRQKISDLEIAMADEIATVAGTEPEIEKLEMKPLRGGVTVRLFALGWMPAQA